MRSPQKADYGAFATTDSSTTGSSGCGSNSDVEQHNEDDDGGANSRPLLHHGGGLPTTHHRHRRTSSEGLPAHRRIYDAAVSEGFVPLYRRASRASERYFTPLYRTVSESVQTLAHPTFALSQGALDLQADRRKAYVLGDTTSRGTSSVLSEVLNITKNTIGGGVMSLSGGMALYASDPRAILSAAAWILGLGVLFGYFCWLTGRACDRSRSATYRECWERTVGSPLGGLLVAAATTLDPFINLFVNSAILSQSLRFALRGLLGIEWSIPACLLFVGVVALLPLCLMDNLDALAPFSAAGIVAVFVALACMVIRCVDGTYAPGGAYNETLPPDDRPAFGARNDPWSFSIMPFACRIFTSFDMHYNAPIYYAELKDATVPRFARVCACSFGLVSCVYLSIALVGYLTFGGHSRSFILNNYAPDDGLATVARISMGFSSLLTYPLNFMGMRDNLLDLLGLTDQFKATPSARNKRRIFVVLLLAFCIALACFVTDLGLISSVGGGTNVALVAFVFPAIMFWRAVRHQNGRAIQMEAWFVVFSMIAMALVGITGVASSLVLGAS